MGGVWGFLGVLHRRYLDRWKCLNLKTKACVRISVTWSRAQGANSEGPPAGHWETRLDSNLIVT